MMNLFSEDVRRNPYPLYEQIHRSSPVMEEPVSGLWMLFDYESVKRALNDPENFSSHYGPDWLIFTDPPRHGKLRALISKAFTPASVTNLEPRIRELSRELLDAKIKSGEMDLAVDFSAQLPLLVIAEMLGIPAGDRVMFTRWVEVILLMSYTIGQKGSAEAANAQREFMAVTAEMDSYLTTLLQERRVNPKDDLLTRLEQAEVEGERLSQQQILGFFQLLLLAGSETTTNLINNAMLCFMEHPLELGRLNDAPEMLPSAIEEVLRFRSPLHWLYRFTKKEVELHGKIIPAQKLVLTVIGSANRDPAVFPEPNRFDIARNPNPHIAFGHGLHFCLGAALGRLEARVALTELLQRLHDFQPASREPWEPRRGLHVHGPSRLKICFSPGERRKSGSTVGA